MKRRLLSFGLVGMMLIAAVGCGQATKETAKTENKEVVLYVTRHGKTMLNTSDRVQGWADSPLTEEGRKVAEYLGKGLKNVKFNKVYSSDSGRAIETAKIALDKSGQKGLEITQRKDLREACFGEYEGELNHTFYSALAAANNMTPNAFMQSFDMGTVLDTCSKIDKSKQAESAEQVSKRMRSEIDKIAEEASKNGGGNVLIVSHGISIMSLLYTIAPESLDKLTEGLSNASITKIVYKDGKYKVESLNDMSYVEKGKGSN